MTNTNEIEAAELNRSPAQFFFEVGFGACWAEATVSNGGKPFDLTDEQIERAWRIAHEAHEDPAEFERYLALANPAASARGVADGSMTDEMVEAGCVAMFGAGSKPDAGWPEYVKTAAIDIYRAMLSAAPSSPAATPEVEAIARIILDVIHQYGNDDGFTALDLANDAAAEILALRTAPTTPEVEREDQREAILEIIRDCTDDDGFLHNPFDVVRQILDLFRAPPAPAGEEKDKAYKALSKHLLDPVAVRNNMLAGGIAKPSPANIWHLYGNDALIEAMPDDARAALTTTGFIAGRDAAAGVARAWQHSDYDASANAMAGNIERDIAAIQIPGEGSRHG